MFLLSCAWYILRCSVYISSIGRLKPQLQEPKTEDQPAVFDGGLLCFLFAVILCICGY